MKIIVWICRILVGLLFIFSGLIKLNDPSGFAIKLEEYFVVFGTEIFIPLTVALSIFICALEIVLGIALLIGAEAKKVTWGLLLLIVFFTFLTFYSAYFNKVTDCGCFGDAIKLTPWQSFSKDLILLVLILVLFLKKETIDPLLGQKQNWGIIGGSFLLSAYMGLYCYQHLPVIDFLPYKVGNNIPEQMRIPPGAEPDVFQVMYTLKNVKTGEIKEVDDKVYISSGIWEDKNWEYISSSDPVLVKKGYTPKIKNLRITDEDGNEFTEDIINNPNFSFLVVEGDLTETNKDVQKRINEIALGAEEYNIRTIGITNASAYDAEVFRHDVNAYYEFYFLDATEIKSMVRSNPGLILLKNGVVINKWAYRDIPSYAELKAEYFDN